MNDQLLETLSEGSLPALPSERSEPAEPQEPTERHDVIERGRSPDEVVQRETRLPAEDERRYEVGGVRYTAKELEKSGRLEDLTVAQAKYAQLQEQYNQLIAERQAPAPPTQITNQMIAHVYDQVATVILNDLVNRDLIEADIADAYPRSVQTLVGQLRFAFDKIAAIEAKVDPVIAEITAAKWKVQANLV